MNESELCTVYRHRPFNRALDSSVGRAVDCSCDHQTSIGRWFKSGSREFFVLSIGGVKVGSTLHGSQLSIPR